MAILDSYNGAALLSSAQTGNGDSTNTAYRARFSGVGGAVVITTTVGATPTVTVQILGSVNGADFYKIGYALVATPETVTVADIVITTAVTTTYLLRPGAPHRYVKLNYTANTNVTLTANAYL